MNRLDEKLIERIGEGLEAGENFLDLSKEVSLPLEDVIAVAYGLDGRSLKKSGAFTEGQSEYLRSCVQYRVPYESMGKMLGVEPIPQQEENSIPSPLENRVSSPYSNGQLKKNKPKLTIDDRADYQWFDILDGIGQRSPRDSDLLQASADQKMASLIG